MCSSSQAPSLPHYNFYMYCSTFAATFSRHAPTTPVNNLHNHRFPWFLWCCACIVECITLICFAVLICLTLTLDPCWRLCSFADNSGFMSLHAPLWQFSVNWHVWSSCFIIITPPNLIFVLVFRYRDNWLPGTTSLMWSTPLAVKRSQVISNCNIVRNYPVLIFFVWMGRKTYAQSVFFV